MQALAHRMAEEMYAKLAPLVARHDLTPVAKLNLLFGLGTKYKTEHLPMIRAMTEIYYRVKRTCGCARASSPESIAVVGPLFAWHPRRGARRRQLHHRRSRRDREPHHPPRHLPARPRGAGRLASPSTICCAAAVAARPRGRLDAYTNALERILGVTPGALDVLCDGRHHRHALPLDGETLMRPTLLLLALVAARTAPSPRRRRARPNSRALLLQRADDLYRGEQSHGVMEMEVKTRHWSRSMSLEAWSKGKRLLARAHPRGRRRIAARHAQGQARPLHLPQPTPGAPSRSRAP